MSEEYLDIQKSPSRGWSALSLCIAQVIEIHWEEFRCTLEIIQGLGNGKKTYSGVELLMPSYGNRHFLGGIPEIGDQCVVGWFTTGTDGTNEKTPAIIAWWTKSTFLGHDWIMTQGFSPNESVMETNKDRQRVKNYHQRIRHKLKHYSPGNIGASSAQGSDMHLDESVHLSNRRSNEILIRDQDQAIVMRSLQQFHAMSGTRVYAGMVQRDARSLPREMFSDGIKWDSSIQLDEFGDPYNPFSEDYEKHSLNIGTLDPHPFFSRGKGSTFSDLKDRSHSVFIPPPIDPYRFLYNASLISESLLEENNIEGTTYGGKSIFRVGNEFGENAVEKGDAFTEYRIELTHTTDGLLPVTEQTDGFDSDRVSDTRGETKNAPFIEWVLGTPTGNDPFSNQGKSLYGLPLVPLITETTGEIVKATETTPFSDHSATLLRISPLVPNLSDSFVSFTKGGKFRARISNPSPDSVQVLNDGGLNLNSNTITTNSETAEIKTVSKTSLESEGFVEIKSTGSQTSNEDIEGDSEVSVKISGDKRISLQSGTAISFKAPIVDFSQAGDLRLSSSQQLQLSTGAGLTINAQSMKSNVVGENVEVSTGPTDLNALQGAIKKTKVLGTPITGFPGGASDEYVNAYGGKSETYLTVANNTKVIPSGSETKTIGAGVDTTIVSGNSTIVDPTGFKFTAPAGAIAMTSGSACSILGNAVSVRGNGAVIVSGASVSLGSPGAAVGSILCGSDIHPILGVPYQTIITPRGQNLITTG